MCVAASTWALAGQERSSEIKPNDGLHHARGELVAPVFEGWFRDETGTLMLSFGYLNRNYAQELDIPIGPDNKFEPIAADQGQPTHFVSRRQWGIFAVPVPKPVEQRLVAEKKSITWTLRANNQTVTIPANMTAAVYVPAPRANLIRESGHSLGGRPGIVGTRTSHGVVVVTIGSGHYEFQVG